MHTSQIPAAFAARKGIDLAAPGGVEALLEFHRGFFGDATMQEDSDGDGQQGDPAASAGEQEHAGDGGDEQLGEPGKKALTAEREANRQLRSELTDLQKRLKDYEDRDKTAEQKQAEHLTELEQQAATAKSSLAEKDALLLRYQVAAEKGLDLSAAERLRGATKDEIAADADDWISTWGTGKTPARQHVPDPGQGARTTPKEDDYSVGQARARQRFGTPNT
ncbi:hypothetical protein [Micrococcus luteus]|uniref:hypothetical protein n=1 Tax=Micrococcus luteus TaxID=1270 RepID=UPI000BF3EF04|nr:hypothetical protein BX598_1874 [Micrococcaceae bacterium JKS001869]